MGEHPLAHAERRIAELERSCTDEFNARITAEAQAESLASALEAADALAEAAAQQHAAETHHGGAIDIGEDPGDLLWKATGQTYAAAAAYREQRDGWNENPDEFPKNPPDPASYRGGAIMSRREQRDG